METYSYLRRQFLNEAPEELIHTSYVLATVENSFEGEYHSTGALYLADCKRTIRLEFYLGRAEARTASIAKVNLLLKVLGEFRNALTQEAYLITKVEKQSEEPSESFSEDNEQASESLSADKIQKRGGRPPRTKPKLLAAKLKVIREKLQMSQSQLVTALDVKISTARISEYEKGTREPNMLLLLAYARLADVAVETLIDDTDVSLLGIHRNSE